MWSLKKIAQNTHQHCYTKLGKKPKIGIFRCLKNHVKIELEIWNFAGRLDLDQIDCKKCFTVQEYREVGFLKPLFYNRLSWSILCMYVCMYVCIYGHVHWSLRILVNKNNSVFDDSGLILAIINLARSEVLNISHVTHTPICTAQK